MYVLVSAATAAPVKAASNNAGANQVINLALFMIASSNNPTCVLVPHTRLRPRGAETPSELGYSHARRTSTEVTVASVNFGGGRNGRGIVSTPNELELSHGAQREVSNREDRT